MATPSPSLPTTAELLAERQARKSVMLAAAVGMGATLLALALAIGGLARTMRVDLEIGGWALVTLLAAAVVGGAAALARAVVLRSWWRGAAVSRLQRITNAAVGGGLAGYALAALLVRLLLIGLLDEPRDLGEPIYDIVLLLAGAIVAAIAGVVTAAQNNTAKTT